MLSSGRSSQTLSRCVAQRLELGVSVPGRDGRGIADRRAQVVDDLCQLCCASQIEVRAILVGGLVIAMGSIVFRLLKSPPAGPTDVVDATSDGDRWNARLGEGEVIGPIEVTGLRMRVGRETDSFR